MAGLQITSYVNACVACFHYHDRHYQRKRVIQYSRDPCVTEGPQRTGYPAFAGYDTCFGGDGPYSAGLAAGGTLDEAALVAAFFSTIRTAMMAPS